jgi:hypothetical protein
VKNVGKPCEGKSHARFDEEGLENPALYSIKSADSGPEVKLVAFWQVINVDGSFFWKRATA